MIRIRQKRTASPALSKGRPSAPQKQRRPSHLLQHARKVDSDEGETEFDSLFRHAREINSDEDETEFDTGGSWSEATSSSCGDKQKAEANSFSSTKQG